MEDVRRVTIERLGHGGDGIGGAPPVYVRRALPGEVVEGDVVGDRMAAPRILEPSADRVRPPCPHYKSCGGCDLMHASDGFVEDWKADVVRSALAAHGLDAPIRGVHTSAPATRRRAVLAGTRTKGGALVGFHARASDRIVPIGSCAVLVPEILSALGTLEEITQVAAPRRGEVRFAITATDAGLDVAVTGAKALDPEGQVRVVPLMEKGGIARLAWNGEAVALRATPTLRIGPARVCLPPGAFLQATKEGEAALLAGVTEAIGDARRVVDLFAGAGTFALPLARSAEVHAVEADDALLSSLDKAWREAAGLKRVTTESRDLFRRPLLPDELGAFDAAVIDPPRAGAEAQTAELAAGGPARVAAVSCNPVTFARDAALLVASGYRLDWIEVVDQFRWSPHVELVAGLRREKSDPKTTGNRL